MTVYALCPNCGNSIVDSGESRFITCKKCGRKLPSRVYGMMPSRYGGESLTSFPGGIAGAEIPWGARENKRPPSIFSALRSIGGFLCSMAIIAFIITLLINFLIFFPAIAITAPGLLNEHELDIETEISLIIDNTPPKIFGIFNNSNVINSIPGEPIKLAINISELNLKETYIELLNDTLQNSNVDKYRLWLNKETNYYHTTFQTPINPGVYHPKIIAIDHAGNYAELEFVLNIQNNTKSVLFINNPLEYFIINSSTDLHFELASDDIQKITYAFDNLNQSISLESPFSIPTAGLSEDEHQLNLSIDTTSGNKNYLNFTIRIDDTPPKLSTLSITPLTVARNKTFRNGLNEDTFYRGEIVNLSIYIDDMHLTEAYVLLENSSYTLVRDLISENSNRKNGIKYHSILPMPNQPGEYHVKIIAQDFTGNIKTISRKIQIARINFDYVPVPVLGLEGATPKSTLSLPMVNSTTSLKISIESGKISGLKYTSNQDESSKDLLLQEDLLKLSGLQEGNGVLNVHAQKKYQYKDYLFITLPIPPYLFILPFALTSIYLLSFFIFIALSIVLSNFYLFRSSLSEAIHQIKYALEKLKAPMMESNNSLIMLAQLFLAVISFNIIYNWILALGRVSVNAPDFSSLSTWALIYNFTSAAVYEEIISRSLLIGVPLLIAHLIMGQVKTPKYRYILGGGFEINKLTIILIIISALTFGLAHTPGWDYWKVIPTLVGGFALGYLFIKKGIFVAILLHFSINFLTIPLHLLNYPLGPSIIFSFLLIFWVLIGLIYINYYIIKIANQLTLHKSVPIEK